MRKYVSIIAVLAILSLIAPPSYTGAGVAVAADTPLHAYPGTVIHGYIRSMGAPVYAAHVALLDSDGDVVAETYTGLNGYYEVAVPSDAEPGEYTLVVEKKGYATATKTLIVEPDPLSTAVLGDPGLAAVLRRTGFHVAYYTMDNMTLLIKYAAHYRYIVIDRFGGDPGAFRVIALIRALTGTNSTVLVLGGYDDGDWTGLYTLYMYREKLSSYGIPLPTNYTSMENTAALQVLEPGNPIFYPLNYTADPQRHMLYITGDPSKPAPYAATEYDADLETLAVIAAGNATYPGVTVWSRGSEDWYYLSVGASTTRIGYTGTNTYSWGVRQIIINILSGETGYTATITGSVINSTREPIPHARIRLLGTNITATTDQNGSFEITGLPPSIYVVEASHPGYFTKTAEVAVKPGGEANVTIRLLSPNDRGWLILVYLDGDNNLEDAAIDDFNEMEMIGSGDDYTILVLFDRIPGYDSSNGDWTGTRLYRVLHDNDPYTINSEQLPLWDGSMEEELNMGDNNTLYNFVRYAYQLYPAQQVALILWDHGSGFKTRGGVGVNNVAYDDTDGDSLDEPEIRATLGKLYLVDGIKVNLVAFDACLMGMYEIAYEIAEYSDVVVFSEETEPGDGYPYHYWLDDVAANPYMDPEQLGYVMVEAYSEEYSGWGDVTQSALRLSVVREMVTQLNQIASYMKDNMGSLVSDISSAKSNAQGFYYDDYKDLYDFFTKLRQTTSDTTLKDMITGLLNTYTSAVINEWHGGSLPGAHGASIWVPDSMSWNSYKYRYLNLKFAKDTQWDEMLEAYFGAGGSSLAGPSVLDGASQPYSLVPAATGWLRLDIELAPLSTSGFLIIYTDTPCYVTVVTENYLEHYYVAANDTRIPIPPYGASIEIRGPGVKPMEFTATLEPGQEIVVETQHYTPHVALIGGTEGLAQALRRRNITVDLYENATQLTNITMYDAVIVSSWGENATAETIITILTEAYAYNKSVIILDAPVPGAAGGAVAEHATEILAAGYPAPVERREEPGVTPYIMADKPHPVLGNYTAKTPRPMADRPSGVVYYPVVNTTRRTAMIEEIAYASSSVGAVKGPAVVVAWLDNNHSYIAYVGYGSTVGDDYGEASYTSGAADAVAGLVYYTEPAETVPPPVPVPEPVHPLSILAVGAAVLLISIVVSGRRRRDGSA